MEPPDRLALSFSAYRADSSLSMSRRQSLEGDVGNAPTHSAWKAVMHLSTSIPLKMEYRLRIARSLLVLQTRPYTCQAAILKWVGSGASHSDSEFHKLGLFFLSYYQSGATLDTCNPLSCLRNSTGAYVRQKWSRMKVMLPRPLSVGQSLCF